MRELSLGLYFEGAALFTYGHVHGLRSRAEVDAILATALTLAVEGEEIGLKSNGTILRCVSGQDDGDEFGRWPEGANRGSEDDYRQALIGYAEFLAALPHDPSLRPLRWTVAEYEIDENGHMIDVIGGEAGEFGKPESHRRCP